MEDSISWNGSSCCFIARSEKKNRRFLAFYSLFTPSLSESVFSIDSSEMLHDETKDVDDIAGCSVLSTWSMNGFL